MIQRHIDIWAVLLLLFAFAAFTRTNDLAIRIARARFNLMHRIDPVEVHFTPWHFNSFHVLPPDRGTSPHSHI